MNKKLKNEIVNHICSNFKILDDSNQFKSLIHDDYILSEKLEFDDQRKQVWGIQINDVKILLGNCSIDNPEFSLIIQMKDCPFYGLYWIPGDQYENYICFSIDGKNWMECSTFLQATFLSAMEQIKDSNFIHSNIKDYNSQFLAMKSFINFVNELNNEE